MTVTDELLENNAKYAISQRLLGTDEIILIHHTDCVMLTVFDVATGKLNEV